MRSPTAIASLFCLVLLAATSIPNSDAFTLPTVVQRPSTRVTTQLFLSGSAIDRDDPEVKAAIEQVRKCAANFSDETAHFASVWIENVLSGNQDASPAGLLEECLLDDEACNCKEFDAALKKLSSMIGVSSNEQY